jgi:hypothetical protein
VVAAVVAMIVATVIATAVVTVVPPVVTRALIAAVAVESAMLPVQLTVKRIMPLLPTQSAEVPQVPSVSVVAAVHGPDVANAVADSVPNGRADKERQGCVVGVRPGCNRHGQGCREHTGAEQDGRCLDHVCLQVISDTATVVPVR